MFYLCWSMFIYVYLCRVYLGAPIYLCFIYVYLCSTRAPSSFIHVLCIFIYVRTYEPCLVRFYRVFYLYHVVRAKRNIYAWPTCNKKKSKINFTYALKKFTHMCLKIFTHLCIQGWSCALKRFTHLCIDIFYLCCYAWMSHVHPRNLTNA
jgi:hypothetical protein